MKSILSVLFIYHHQITKE